MAATNYPLRVSASIMKEAKLAAAQDGVSLNQFIGTALAEKVSALRTYDILESRAKKADRRKFDEVLTRIGRNPPRKGDELP
ncbi:MAG: toxin-antitoxin system HicB family antitoxin [Rhodospirillales bacterium]